MTTTLSPHSRTLLVERVCALRSEISAHKRLLAAAEATIEDARKDLAQSEANLAAVIEDLGGEPSEEEIAPLFDPFDRRRHDAAQTWNDIAVAERMGRRLS